MPEQWQTLYIEENVVTRKFKKIVNKSLHTSQCHCNILLLFLLWFIIKHLKHYIITKIKKLNTYSYGLFSDYRLLCLSIDSIYNIFLLFQILFLNCTFTVKKKTWMLSKPYVKICYIVFSFESSRQ